MNNSETHNQRIAKLALASLYPHYLCHKTIRNYHKKPNRAFYNL